MKDGYAICFNEWALDKEIKSELGLLLIISSLTAEKGYCYASNKYFADLFEMNETLISRKIKKLEEKKYIIIEYEKCGSQIKSRTIRLSKMITDHYRKRQSSIIENDKENNTSINNTSINNNIYCPAEAEQQLPYKAIIDYLNIKIGTHYKHTTPKTKALIKARFNEGFTLEDFKTVIDKKYIEWFKDKKMNKYLRPETLFSNKFEGYVNQPIRQITTKDIQDKIDFSNFMEE